MLLEGFNGLTIRDGHVHAHVKVIEYCTFHPLNILDFSIDYKCHIFKTCHVRRKMGTLSQLHTILCMHTILTSKNSRDYYVRIDKTLKNNSKHVHQNL